MTPLLHRFLKRPATTSLVKIEQRQEAQKVQEVHDVTEKVSHTEEVVEEGAEVAPLEETVVLLAEVKEKAQLRGDISVTDTAKKGTRLTKRKVVPKSAAVVVDESEITTLKEESRKGRSEEVISVRMIEEIPDERTGVVPQPDQKQVSERGTGVSVRRERERSIKTESKEVREQEVEKEGELVKDISLMTETDETKPFPIIISTGARKQTQTLESERKVWTEESIDQDVQIISAVRTKEFTFLPAQEKMVEETHLKPAESTEDQSRVKVHEAAQKLTSEKESVTDIELKKWKVIQRQSESVAARSGGLQKKKKPEESRSEDTVQTRTSSQTASRGTQRNQQGSSCLVPCHLHIT